MKPPPLPCAWTPQPGLLARRNRRLLQIAVCFSTAVLAVVPTALSQAIAVPSYVQPGSTVGKSWAGYPHAPKIMIVNLDNGDDTNFYPSVLPALQSAQASGIKVLGYTYTGYGRRDPNTIEEKIAAAEHNYALHGIFPDEAPVSCTAATSRDSAFSRSLPL